MPSAWNSGVGVQTTCSSEKIYSETQPCTALLVLTKLWTSKELGLNGRAVSLKHYLNACKKTPRKYLRAWAWNQSKTKLLPLYLAVAVWDGCGPIHKTQRTVHPDLLGAHAEWDWKDHLKASSKYGWTQAEHPRQKLDWRLPVYRHYRSSLWFSLWAEQTWPCLGATCKETHAPTAACSGKCVAHSQSLPPSQGTSLCWGMLALTKNRKAVDYWPISA